MTQPQQAEQQSDTPKRSYRPGQIVSYRLTDTHTGDQLTGHALVLKVTGDQADLAFLGVGHASTHVDNLAPAKAEDVPNPLPAPQAAEGSTGS